MKKNKGYTLLEILIAVALLAIFATLLMPLGTAYTKSHKRLSEINELDLELSKTVDIIKRGIRAAQEDDSGSNAILDPADDGTTSSGLTITIRDDDTYEYVTFWHVSDENEFRVTSEATSKTAIDLDSSDGSLLMSGVETVEFRYSENIVTIYLVLTKGDITREIRDAGVTRIDYQISKSISDDLD